MADPVKVNWDNDLTLRLLDIIAKNNKHKNAIFPRPGASRPSLWKATQAVCIELFTQTNDEAWFEFQQAQGRVEKRDGVWHGAGGWKSTWYDPVRTRLNVLGKAYKKIQKEEGINQAWASWDDVPRDKRDALKESTPWYFAYHHLLSPTPLQLSVAPPAAGSFTASTSSTSGKRKRPPPAAAFDPDDSEVEEKPIVKRAARSSTSGGIMAGPAAPSVDRKPVLAPRAGTLPHHAASSAATPVQARSASLPSPPSPASSFVLQSTRDGHQRALGVRLRSPSIDATGSPSAGAQAAELGVPSDSDEAESPSSDGEDGDMKVDGQGGEANEEVNERHFVAASSTSLAGIPATLDVSDAKWCKKQRKALSDLAHSRKLVVGVPGQRIRKGRRVVFCKHLITELTKVKQLLSAYHELVENGFETSLLVNQAICLSGSKNLPVNADQIRPGSHKGRLAMLRRIIEAFSGLTLPEGPWPPGRQKWQVTDDRGESCSKQGKVRVMTISHFLGVLDQAFMAKFGEDVEAILQRGPSGLL